MHSARIDARPRAGQRELEAVPAIARAVVVVRMRADVADRAVAAPMRYRVTVRAASTFE